VSLLQTTSSQTFATDSKTFGLLALISTGSPSGDGFRNYVSGWNRVMASM
jgi:hypothetical protein